MSIRYEGEALTNVITGNMKFIYLYKSALHCNFAVMLIKNSKRFFDYVMIGYDEISLNEIVKNKIVLFDEISSINTIDCTIPTIL